MKLWKKVIKTKRDRNIAIIFAVLVVFVMSEILWNILIKSITGVGLSHFMMKLFPDKMTYANYPNSYENLFVTAAVLTILFSLGMLLVGKEKKKATAAAGIGLVVTFGVLLAFHIHCRLIVSTAADFETFRGSIYKHSEEGNLHLDVDPKDEEARELVRLCYELEPYGKEKQKELWESIDRQNADATRIWIVFSRQYGHEFWLSVDVGEDYIFIDQTGRQGEMYTFYKDNGLIEKLSQIMGTELE